MSQERDVTRLVRSWIREDEHESARGLRRPFHASPTPLGGLFQAYVEVT